MHARLTRLVIVLGALCALSLGGIAAASTPNQTTVPGAHKKHAVAHKQHAKKALRTVRAASRHSAETPGTETGDSGADTDSAAQATACKAAGIDPNASNVNYDDTAGTCSLDAGNSNN